MTFVIGITGGIASGKSTIARMIAKRGILHLDADKLVHRLLASDRETIAEIKKTFPSAVKKDSVDRKALGAAVAGDAAKLKRLEQILHPRVRHAEEQAILLAARQRRRAVLLDIPLMFETGAEILCDVVIAAHAPLPMRRRRAFGRLGMTEATFNRLVARQLSEAERNRRADIVIPTTIGKAHTRRIVDALLHQWKLV
jgi:dephospho-CoA kinase